MTSPRTAFSTYLAAQDAVARSPTSARAQRALARARDAYASAAQSDPAAAPAPALACPYPTHTPARAGGSPANLARAREALRLARLARASPST